VACQIARHPVGSLRTGALFSALPQCITMPLAPFL
jgi:hypothetical protein